VLPGSGEGGQCSLPEGALATQDGVIVFYIGSDTVTVASLFGGERRRVSAGISCSVGDTKWRAGEGR